MGRETVGRRLERRGARAVQDFALFLLENKLLQFVLHVGAFAIMLLLLLLLLMLLLVAHQLLETAVVIQVFQKVGLERLFLILQQQLSLEIKLLL